MDKDDQSKQDFEILRTHNPDVIKRVLTIPELWEVINEDGGPDRDQYEPPIDDSIIYLLAVRDNKILGMFIVHPVSRIIAMGHANILPRYWGEREQNKAIGKAMIQWVWDNTPYEKIITTVPTMYKHVLAYTQRIGMKREGIMRKGYRKHGELHDQYYMGVNR